MLLTASEQNLIDTIDQRFVGRRIKDTFNLIASVAPDIRLAKADEVLQSVPRSGWTRVGVPTWEAQTVWQHQQAMVHLLQYTGGSAKAQEMAKVHDICESVTGDFNPTDPITKQEKHTLEAAIAKVIFEGNPDKMALWQEYEARQTKDAQLVKDIDMVELVGCSIAVEHTYPKSAETLKDFWRDSKIVIKTDEGKSLFSEMQKSRELVIAGAAVLGGAYAYTRKKGHWRP